MRHTQPTSAQVQGWKEWVAERPPAVRVVAERFDPWTLYRLKTTGQRVYILSFSDPSLITCNWCGGNGGPVPPGGDPCNNCGGSGKIEKVTCRVGVSGEFNLITYERDVFGINPDDLEECDLPGPGEQVGTLDLPVDVVKNLYAVHPDGVPRHVMLDLISRYPLKRGGQNQ